VQTRGELTDDRIDQVLIEGLAAYGQAVADDLLERMGDAVGNETAVRLGFEARLAKAWAPALDRLEALLIAASEAGETYIAARRRRAGWDERQEALARISARSCLIGREVLTLLRAGFASGAHARWRSLQELAVVAFFLGEHDAALSEAYLLHHQITAWRNFRTYKPHAIRLDGRPISAAEEAEHQRAVDALVRRFGPGYEEEWGWAASTLGHRNVKFAQIEAAVEMSHRRPEFQMANHPVHAGSRALYFDLGAEASRGVIWLAGQSNTGLGEPGGSTAIALSQITGTLLTSADDIAADDLVIAHAVRGLAVATSESFAEREAEMDRLVAIRRGFASRLLAFARRGRLSGRLRSRRGPGSRP
jgi:hypothetical protein